MQLWEALPLILMSIPFYQVSMHCILGIVFDKITTSNYLRWQIELHFHFRFQPDMNFILCLSWLWIATETRNSCFLVFLNFLFLGKKWGTRNKKSIFFNFSLSWPKFGIFQWFFLNIMKMIHIFMSEAHCQGHRLRRNQVNYCWTRQQLPKALNR